MLFDDLIALCCNVIDIESSAEGKKRKREFGQKEQTMKRIRCCVIGVFGSPRMFSCVKYEKQASVDKRGVMVEEWKARRKEWKKKRRKKGKREKVVLGKVLFVLFDCVFAFSLFPLHPPHHATTHALTHPPHHTTRCIGAHHHMQTGSCAVLPFFGSGQRNTHCIIRTPHSIT